MNKDSIIVALAAKAGYWVSGNFSELQRWIREQHHIHIDVQPQNFDSFYGYCPWEVYIQEIPDKEYCHKVMRSRCYETEELYVNDKIVKDWKTYEEAFKVGLIEALKFIITGENYQNNLSNQEVLKS